ncbi:MAG TPA: hypothetical protein VKG38_00725 [Solirubrobacteraceae bacterium]|nr:hypothetical protein [Solirubrobacteraceae bacterium]
MSARRLGPMLVLVFALALALACRPVFAPSPAQAAFAPFELASTDPELGLQAEYAYEPAVSPEGRYVAFTGVVAAKHGVYRKDLLTGELATVALGIGAGAPSISEGGRYVSFTTSEDPANPGTPLPGGCTQVYRRDMEETGPDAYEIVSARSGSEEPLTYEGCSGGGSASANRVAISADGSKVAFTAIGRSNLTGEAGRTETPGDQVAVRNFAETPPATVLVSVEKGTQNPVSGGATLSGRPKVTVETPQISQDNVSTASISADGTTVAWMGINVFAQTELNEPVKGVGEDFPAVYAEPLWRRIADGPAAPTRRVLAGDDPSAPGCPPECQGGLDLTWDEQFEIYRWPELAAKGAAGPREGSFVEWALRGVGSELQAVTPQLSADGTKVAILSTQPDYGHLPNFGQFQTEPPNPTANAFVVNMAPGLTREQAITRLTEWASLEFSSSALDGPIADIAISADGTRVLFVTERNVFPLAPPALITERVSQVGIPQLYEANLQAGTLALVSQGYNGEPADAEGKVGGAKGAALSADGKVLALASGSSNLADGTVNEGSAVFVTREQDSPEAPGQQAITSLPPQQSGEPEWSISATAHGSHDGALLIDVSVPGAGRLAASASAPVPVIEKLVRRSRGRATRRRRGRAAATRARTVTVIASRQVARAAAAAAGEGVIELRLVPSSHYHSLVVGRDGLYATITVTFAAPGHRKLTETLQAGFPRPSVIHHPARPRA